MACCQLYHSAGVVSQSFDMIRTHPVDDALLLLLLRVSMCFLLAEMFICVCLAVSALRAPCPPATGLCFTICPIFLAVFVYVVFSLSVSGLPPTTGCANTPHTDDSRGSSKAGSPRRGIAKREEGSPLRKHKVP